MAARGGLNVSLSSYAHGEVTLMTILKLKLDHSWLATRPKNVRPTWFDVWLNASKMKCFLSITKPSQQWIP